MPSRTALTFATAAALALAGARALADSASSDDVRAELAALKAKVARLENQQETQNKQAEATINSVIGDAAVRTHALAAGAGSAGHDDERGGFTIASGNDFLLNIGLGIQFRNVTNYAQNSKNGGASDSIDNGFEMTRARLLLQGNAWTPDLTYFIQWDAGEQNGGMTLLDAYVKYRFAEEWAVKGGQYKDPGSRESMISPFMQLAVDRSLANELVGTFSGIDGRVQGIELCYGSSRNALRAEVGFHDGLPSGNTNFQDSAAFWGLSGRVDFKVFGDWKDAEDFSARDTHTDLLVVGGSFDFTQGANFDDLKFGGDVQWELASRWSVYGALLGEYFDPRNALPGGQSFDYGAVAQVGYALSSQWEIYGRADIAKFDQAQINNEKTFYELGAGVNYFLGRDGSAFHRAKASIDLSYLPNGCPAVVNGLAATGLGYLNILGGSDSNQLVLRAQFQFMP